MRYKNLNFIPQLFYKEIMLPFGIQSTQIHLNYWKEEDFRKHFWILTGGNLGDDPFDNEY